MSDLASLLGAEMAREAADSRDGFDPASLLDATRRGARGKRRTRATVQAFGALTIVGLTGSAAWLTLGNLDGPAPAASPSPSESPSPSPTASPLPSPTAIGASYERDEYGLPVFPVADNGVIADVGPGWVLAEYLGYAIDGSYSSENAIYLVDPDGRAYLAGRIGVDSHIDVWRPDRNEVVHARVDGSTYVYDLVTHTDTLLDPEDRQLGFHGVTSDGRELWMVTESDQVTMIGMLVVTPDSGEPDTYFARPDIPRNMNWMLIGDRLVVIPIGWIGSSVGTTAVWEVSLDGVVTERPLALPEGATYCNITMIPESTDFLWFCHGEGGPSDAIGGRDGAWDLDLDGGPPRWVPRDDSWYDRANAIEIGLPGCNGVLVFDDPTPGDRPTRWWAYDDPAEGY